MTDITQQAAGGGSAPAAPIVQPAPNTPPAQPTMVATGGSPSIAETFKKLNYTEVIFGVLLSTAMYYIIYYYRNSANEYKPKIAALESQIKELKDEVESMNKKSSIQSSTGGFLPYTF